MSDFIKVDSISSVRLSTRWKDSDKFNSDGRLVNKKNEYVKISYPGSKYIVTWKKEREFTMMEKISRFTKFIFFSLLTFGLCNLNKSYRQLWTKDKLVNRYAVRFDLPTLDFKEKNDKKNITETKTDIKIQNTGNHSLQESQNGNLD